MAHLLNDVDGQRHAAGDSDARCAAHRKTHAWMRTRCASCPRCAISDVTRRLCFVFVSGMCAVVCVRLCVCSACCCLSDVELHLPGAIKAIREYFRDYKSYSGKINTYALRAQAMPRHYAIKVLEETHQHWKSLHLVKKRDTIGESSAQAELRMMAVAGSPAHPAMPAAVPIPAHAQSLLTAAGSPIQRGMSTPASISSPRINGVVQPVGSLTGMEQPLDKLMAGK